MFEELKAAVAELKTVEEGVIATLDALAARVDALVAAGGTPEEFAALTADIRAQREALAAAVVKNTR